MNKITAFFWHSNLIAETTFKLYSLHELRVCLLAFLSKENVAGRIPETIRVAVFAKNYIFNLFCRTTLGKTLDELFKDTTCFLAHLE